MAVGEPAQRALATIAPYMDYPDAAHSTTARKAKSGFPLPSLPSLCLCGFRPMISYWRCCSFLKKSAGRYRRVAHTALPGLRLFSLKKNCVSAYADAMSRLRRPFLTERFFFDNALGSTRRGSGEFWQSCFSDTAPLPMNILAAGRRRALRTVQEYWETVKYIHLNPVRRVEWRLVERRRILGSTRPMSKRGRRGHVIDLVQLPAETRRRI
jgi:hypothetical protein